jgi:hypothetical protein
MRHPPPSILLLTVALSLPGCRSRETPPGRPAGSDSSSSPVSRPVPPSPSDSLATIGPPDVIRGYYTAIRDRDFRRAYEMWAEGGTASGQTLEQFAAGFARTARVEVEIVGPERTEGAAGSIYAEVDVVVRARTTDGEDQRFEGTYTLRRVNDVPGATPEQLRWHIQSANLTRAP